MSEAPQDQPQDQPCCRTLEIVNEKGLHARASAKFVELVESYEGTDCMVRREGQEASGDSIMGLLMLAAARGTSIDIEVTGPAAVELAHAIEDLIANKFGEGE